MIGIPNGELFSRECEVTIDTLKLGGNRVAFRVTKTIKPEPNTCELTIWNLSENHRAALEELAPKADDVRGISVKIDAGYNGSTALVWLGDLRTVDSYRDGPDWITVLGSGDGEKACGKARVALPFGPGTPVETALRAMLVELGVGPGNITTALAMMHAKGVATTMLSSRSVIYGSVAARLTDLARSADLEWSIQDGAIQFTNRGQAIEGLPVLLSAETGMIGSPTVDNEGVLTVQSLMIPDIRPGRLVVMATLRIHGAYRIERAEWDGDTFGGNWYVTMEAKRV